MIMYVQQTEPVLLKADNVMQQQKISRKRDRSHFQRSTSEPVPESKKRKVAAKSVGFRNLVEIMPAVSTTTTDDWYNDADAIKFRLNVKRDVQYLAKLCKENRVRDMDQTEYCTVGIERYCVGTATRTQAKALKEQRVKAILDEQRMQELLGTSDPEIICQLAQQYSQQPRDRALQLAARLV